MTKIEFVQILLTAGSTVLGAYVGVKVAIAELRTKVDILSEDIDAIALFVGTPRAIAKAKLRREKL